MEFPRLRKRKYDDVRKEIRSGDILLCSGQYTFSKLIQKVTGSWASHVAFIMPLVEIDRVMVLESIESRGVRTIPLSEYTRNFEGTGAGYKGRLVIARHQAMEEIDPTDVTCMAQFAIDRFGYPYDEEEIGRIMMRIMSRRLKIFSNGELRRNKEYICSEYVYECYMRLGIQIQQQDPFFIAPSDYILDPKIKLLWEVVP